jgi:PucR C-terminal helix-turn-helix domain
MRVTFVSREQPEVAMDGRPGRGPVRRTAGHGLRLPPEVVGDMRSQLPAVAERVVDAVVEEVPSYTEAFDSTMAETIRNAVALALAGFLSLASGRRGADPGTPTAPAVEGSYQLGRGEARSGRSTDALLAAFRVGARVSWREMSMIAVRNGVEGDMLVDFAELVFAYIDELSAAAVAGHTDELTTTGRARQRMLERVAHHLLSGSPVDQVVTAADRAGWEPPQTLTAVIVPEAQVRPVLSAVSPATLQAADVPELEDGVLLLVPDAHAHRRGALLRTLADRGSIAGPARPWLEVRGSYDRALRARAAGIELDTEAHLVRLVLDADPAARADLRAALLAPLDGLRPGTAEKLVDTLRSWLLHQGRREEVAAELFVHPQTVRYRMGQLRELYGDRLDDPETVLALVVALG